MEHDIFCYWHIEARENETDTETILACTAHLHEARCFKCPYIRDEIYEEGFGKKRIAPRGTLGGICEDFIPKQLTN